MDLSQRQVVEECNLDRFQLLFMPHADGAEYDDRLFKLHQHLVKDTIMNVSVVRTAPEYAGQGRCLECSCALHPIASEGGAHVVPISRQASLWSNQSKAS